MNLQCERAGAKGAWERKRARLLFDTDENYGCVFYSCMETTIAERSTWIPNSAIFLLRAENALCVFMWCFHYDASTWNVQTPTTNMTPSNASIFLANTVSLSSNQSSSKGKLSAKIWHIAVQSVWTGFRWIPSLSGRDYTTEQTDIFDGMIFFLL